MNPGASDQEHLRLLEIFHYIVGGITALIACFPLIHFSVGVAMILSPNFFGSQTAQQPPAFLGWAFAILGALFFLGGQAFAICMILAGRCIRRKRGYLFVFVAACIACLWMPFGTVLGVFTIVVLSRESVKGLFTQAAPPPIPLS